MACACSRAFGRKPCVKASRAKNRLIKLLEAEGIKLANLCSDVLGKSGRAILHALLEGQNVGPRHGRPGARRAARQTRPAFERLPVTVALSDNATWGLAELLTLVDSIEKRIERLDERIAKTLQAYAQDAELLAQIPGLGSVSIAAVLAEEADPTCPSLPPPNT